MTSITRLLLKDIRCFSGEQAVTLPRITLLVGENSTGKTTFLACCSALAKLACNEESGSYNPFNIATFNMGNFETIVRKESDAFKLGGCVGGVEMSFQFSSRNEMPCEEGAKIKPEGMPELQFERMRSDRIWKLTGPSFVFDLNANSVSYEQFSQWLGSAVRYQHLPYAGNIGIFKKQPEFSDSLIAPFVRLTNHLIKLSSKLPLSDAVTRGLRPEINSPMREHNALPLFPDGFEGHEYELTRQRIAQAGRKLKLFSDCNIQRVPGGYALEVTVDDYARNIVDVGFGVHAILPTLKVIGEDPSKTILLQEPETHLHPMAQALLAQLIAKAEGRYLIETHADHIINRLCICVRRGDLTPEDIGILWFEKQKSGAVIHEIKIDEEGNLIDAPAHYREFFDCETEAFLGF